jgi:hypothetical protein
MENIIIPVPAFIAQAFAKADLAQKRKAEIYINAWLNDFFSVRSANEQLFDLMEKGTAEAKENGLTPDKLAELLRKDDN